MIDLLSILKLIGIISVVLVDILFIYRYCMNILVLKTYPMDEMVKYFCRHVATKEFLFFMVGLLNPLLFGARLVTSALISILVYLTLHSTYIKLVRWFISKKSVLELQGKKCRIEWMKESNSHKAVGVAVLIDDPEETKLDVVSQSGYVYPERSEVPIVDVDYNSLIIK